MSNGLPPLCKIPVNYCHRGNAPWDFTDTSIAAARLRGCGGNHSCRALFAVGATAVGAERLGILPIRLLREHGIENAEETVVCGRAMLAPTSWSEVQAAS